MRSVKVDEALSVYLSGLSGVLSTSYKCIFSGCDETLAILYGQVLGLAGEKHSARVLAFHLPWMVKKRGSARQETSRDALYVYV